VAYSWEPRWEPVEIRAYGIVIRTCRDKITKMIACPICIHAASKCLGEGVKPANFKEKQIFFFTVEDLVLHIRERHAMGFLLKRLSESEEEESAG